MHGIGHMACPQQKATPHELYTTLCQHIHSYLRDNSMVKLEAALAQLVYDQFKPSYTQADCTIKKNLEDEMNKHIPTRQQIKAYLIDGAIDLHYINTLANFFELSYSLNNHNPAENLIAHTSQS